MRVGLSSSQKLAPFFGFGILIISILDLIYWVGISSIHIYVGRVELKLFLIFKNARWVKPGPKSYLVRVEPRLDPPLFKLNRSTLFYPSLDTIPKYCPFLYVPYCVKPVKTRHGEGEIFSFDDKALGIQPKFYLHHLLLE